MFTGPDEEHQFDQSEEPGRSQPGAGEWERDGSLTTPRHMSRLCVTVMFVHKIGHFISFHIFHIIFVHVRV